MSSGSNGPLQRRECTGKKLCMKKRSLRRLVTLTFWAAVVASSPSNGQELPPNCSSGRSLVNHTEALTDFSRRSVEIVELALRGNITALEGLVSASTRFVLWNGDAGHTLVGLEGATQFASSLDPTGFEYAIAFAGPISIDVCHRVQVTVTFPGSDPERSHIVDFEYAQGRLVEVVARKATHARGDIRGNRTADSTPQG